MAHSQNSYESALQYLPQGRVLSQTLFNIYTTYILLPPKDTQITTYADNITISVPHIKYHKAQQLIQPYPYKIYEWATINNLHINIDKLPSHFFHQTHLYWHNFIIYIKQLNTTTRKYPKILRIFLIQN